MAANQQQRAQHEHRGSLAMMVEVRAQDRRNQHGQQWEHSEDRLSRLAHVTHITIGNQRDDRDSQQTVLQVGLLLEVRCEASSSHNQHDDVLNDGHTR